MISLHKIIDSFISISNSNFCGHFLGVRYPWYASKHTTMLRAS